ncbi:MAG: cupredoxin domain-containing protein [Aquihabitans sp.]
MTIVNLAVVVGALAFTALLSRFFFGAKQSSKATVRAGAQEITVTVKGGYAPDRIEVHQGTPVRITFDRQESGDCTSRVVFSDFGINRSLPAFAQTTVELTPDQTG